MRRVLILDDDQLYNHIVQQQLKEYYGASNIDVITSEKAEEALQIVKESSDSFTCFLIDQNLKSGKKNGLEILQDLRDLAPDTEAIMLTGYRDSALSMEAYQAGAYRFLGKPFEIEELLWMIDEIYGLQLISQLTIRSQRATTLAEVADILVSESVKIGFERARLYTIQTKYNSIEKYLQGLSQVGLSIPVEFNTVEIPLQEATHGLRSYQNGGINFYNSFDEGETVLAKRYKDHYPPPTGEWVDLIIYDGDKKVALLSLDNYTIEKELRSEHRRLLRLLMLQTGAAVSRAIDYEKDTENKNAERIAGNITQQMGDARKPDSLNRLLEAIRKAFDSGQTRCNYIVVLKDSDCPGWVHEQVHHYASRPDTPIESRWRRLDDRSLTSYVINHKSPQRFFNQSEITRFRKRHKLKVLDVPALSWIGIPLKQGNEVIGAIIFEDDLAENSFQASDFILLHKLSNALVGVIQTAWLYERKRIEANKLELIHRVGEQLMVLAEQRMSWMWHAVLTVATAGYGFGFDRAVLLLKQEENGKLQGVMGIGNFDKTKAMADWVKDDDTEMDYATYLSLLRSEMLGETEVEKYVVNRKFDIGPDDGVFQYVLSKAKQCHVSAADCIHMMPQSFVKKFGKTDYSIVPVQAGSEVIGILVLDNVWKTDPQQLGALDYIDRLTDQAGLIYENRRINESQIEFTEKSYPILAEVSEKSLSASLEQICHHAKETLKADGVTIYPLIHNGSQWKYDLDNGAYVGIDPSNLRPTFSEKSFTTKVLREGTMAIDDLSKHRKKYGSRYLQSHPVIKQNNIKSLIAIPVKSTHSQSPVEGIMYLDYFQVSSFTANQIRLANSFGELAWLVMNEKEKEQVRQAEINRKDGELEVLNELQRKALDYDVSRDKLIKLLLVNTKQLFAEQKVKPAFAIVERLPNGKGEPVLTRQQFYLQRKDVLKGPGKRVGDEQVYEGLSGHALQKRKSQYAPNVKIEPWAALYKKQNRGTKSEVDVFIELGNNASAILILESPTEDAFDHECREMAERLGSTIRLALNNLRRQKKLHKIANVAAVSSQKFGVKDTIEDIIEQITKALPDLSAITVWHEAEDSTEWKLGSQSGICDAEALQDPDSTISGHLQKQAQNLSAHGKIVWAEKTTHKKYEPYFNKAIIQEEKIVSSAAFPLWSNEKIVGGMYFHYRYHHKFSKEEKALYRILAESVAHALNDSLQVERIQKEQQRLKISQRVTEAIGTTVALDKTLSVICRLLKTQFKENKAFPLILLYNDFTHRLETVPGVKPAYEINNPQYAYMQPLSHFPMDEDDRYSIGRVVAENVLSGANQEYVYIPNVDNAQAENSTRYLRLRLDTKSLICVPLLSDDEDRNHPLLGILSLESKKIEAFSQNDIKTIVSIAKKVSIAVARAQRIEELRFNSNVINATARLNPILHSVNSEIGKIRRRIGLMEIGTTKAEEEQHLVRMHKSIERIQSEVDTAIPINETEECINLEEELCAIMSEIQEQRSVYISVNIDIEPQHLKAFVQPFAFRKAIEDLVRNALDAMSDTERKEIKITAKFARNKEFVDISISNTGKMIRQTDQPKLLNEVFTTKSKKMGERGMGLLFVRTAIAGMGGKVQFHSSTKEWTKFVVTVKHCEPDQMSSNGTKKLDHTYALTE